jgi:hypothetical protein
VEVCSILGARVGPKNLSSREPLELSPEIVKIRTGSELSDYRTTSH